MRPKVRSTLSRNRTIEMTPIKSVYCDVKRLPALSLQNNLFSLCSFVFLQFYWLKQSIHISMNFVHVIFYIAIFSNMAQRQRARYRVARYVIVNNVTTATLESKTKNA